MVNKVGHRTRKNIRFYGSLGVGLVLVLLNIYGVRLLNKMPWLPDEAQSLVETVLGQEGGSVRLEGIALQSREELEFVLCRRISGKYAGDFVQLTYTERGDTQSRRFQLVSYFARIPFPYIYLIIGFSIIAIGVFIFVLRHNEPRGRLLYWLFITFASAIILIGGYHCLDRATLSFLPACALYVFYALTPAVLLHFALTFLPHSQPKRGIVLAVYLASCVFIILLEVLFLRSVFTGSIHAYRDYSALFPVFRLYVLFFILGAGVMFVVQYRRAGLQEYRLQLKWILFGLVLGLGPFVLLFNLPKSLGLDEFISMEVSMTFCVFVPIAMAIALIRYRLFDIELVIKRSVVYSLLTVFIVAVYLFWIQVLQNIFSQIFEIRDTVVSALAAFGAALAFHPARREIQKFVDRAFFRSSYDYRRAIQSFYLQVHRISDRDQLTDIFGEQVQAVLPMELIGIAVYTTKGEHDTPLILKGGGGNLGRVPFPMQERPMVLARRASVFTEEDIDFSREELLTEKGLDLVVPLSFSVTHLIGYVAFARKKSGEKFTREDVFLLRTLAERLAVNLERILLQEEVVYERAEKEKLDEVNRLKTEFISSVSHELRTPLSTLQSLSELLREGRIKDKRKQARMLGMMSDECARLSHFLHNILGMGRIEQGSMSYHFVESDLRTLVQDTLDLFEYRFQSEGFEVRLRLPEAPVMLSLDPDAMKQALTNLIDNAIKYSTQTKRLDVELTVSARIVLTIRDFGMGISLGELPRIFTGFYRGRKARQTHPAGVGLGLKIVKHIMDAHAAAIAVDSRKGQGSTFTLTFKSEQA